MFDALLGISSDNNMGTVQSLGSQCTARDEQNQRGDGAHESSERSSMGLVTPKSR